MSEENLKEKLSSGEVKELKKGLKKELKRELKEPKKPKRPKIKRACCLGCLIIFLGVILAGVIAVTKTGLVQIPVFSNIFYKTPQPIRVVKIPPELLESEETKKETAERILKQLEKQISANLKTLSEEKSLPLELSFTEQDLTFLIKSATEAELAAGEEEIPIKDAQIAITPEEIEIFGRLTQPVASAITIGFDPILQDGQLQIDITRAKLGNLPAPTSLVNSLVNTLIKAKTEEFRKTLAQAGPDNVQLSLESIELGEGTITVRGKMKIKK